MPAATDRQYELVLMLDPEVADDDRDKIAADARSRIESGGTLKHDESWGMRKMAYDIRQRTEADYRFYRFVGEKPLLDALDHNLKITDGVLRFRIFRVDPRAPLVTPPDPGAFAARPPRRERRDDVPDEFAVDEADEEIPAADAAPEIPAADAAPEIPAADAATEAPEEEAAAVAPEAGIAVEDAEPLAEDAS